MSVSPVAKFFVLKSPKVVASAIIFGLSLAAYSCAVPKDPAASKAGSDVAPAKNGATAEQYQLFAPVFLANLESALTVAKVPAETVTKIMSEIKSPASALGLAAPTGASPSIADLMSAVLVPTQKNVPALSLVTVHSFVAVLAISVARTFDSSLASTIAADVGVSPEQVGNDSAVRAALVLREILNNNPVTPVQGNLAAPSPGDIGDFLLRMELVSVAEVEEVCPREDSSSPEIAALGLAEACSSKANNPFGGDGKTPENKFLIDTTAAKCLGAGIHTICFVARPTVGSDAGLKTFDACIKCSNPVRDIIVKGNYPDGKFNCGDNANKESISDAVTAKLKEEAKKCNPMSSSAPGL